MGGMGCGCTLTRTPAPPTGALLVIGLLGGLVGLRRRAVWLLPLVAGLLSAGLLPACSQSAEGPPVGPGDLYEATNEIGRYQSAAVRGGTILISAYNSTFGDLAFAEIKDLKEPITWQVVDGLPEGMPDAATAGAPRRGFTEPGPDVGRFTALAVKKSGVPVIAYQDVTARAVKLAVGPARDWKISVVDTPPEGVQLGLWTSLALVNDVPVVAYMATGVPRDDGKFMAQLIVAQAQSGNPTGPGDWTRKVVEEVEIPCAGLCGAGRACVAVGMKKDPQPSVCKPVSQGCMPACKMGQACVENACTAVLTAPPDGIPEGTGLYARVLQSGDAPLVVFHNRATGALKMAAGPDFAVKAIDGGDGKVDVGQHLGAGLSEDGTLHVAYVDAVSDRLLFRSVKDGTASMVEVVDDGLRGTGASREQHAVGAGAYVFLDGATPWVVYQDQTARSLEVATRSAGWSRQTKAMGEGQKSRGFYPQAVRFDGSWVLLDVTYDRARGRPLVAVEMTPM
jgi:MYXO-CTERM domain-containing protein